MFPNSWLATHWIAPVVSIWLLITFVAILWLLSQSPQALANINSTRVKNSRNWLAGPLPVGTRC